MQKKVYMGILAAVLAVVLTACGAAPQNVWEDAVYTEDTFFGTGAKTVSVRVVAEKKTVTFAIHTDKETLGEALLEHDLIAGDMGAYGLYVKTVNGMYADYNETKTYWALTKDGGYMSTGVDGTAIADGEKYELTLTFS